MKIESELKKTHRTAQTYEKYFSYGYNDLVTKVGFDIPEAFIVTKLDRYLRYHAEHQINFAYGRVWTRLSRERLHKEIPSLSVAIIKHRLNWLQFSHEVKINQHKKFDIPVTLLCAMNSDHKQAYWWAFSDQFIRLTKQVCEYSEIHCRYISPETRQEEVKFKEIHLDLKNDYHRAPR